MKAKLVAVPIFAAVMGAMTASAWAEPMLSNAPEVGEGKNLRNLYLLRCGTCHGANGEGSARDWPPLGPALKGNPFIANASPAAIIRVLRKGRNGGERLYKEAFPNMPAFGVEAVGDADALVRYLKTDLQK